MCWLVMQSINIQTFTMPTEKHDYHCYYSGLPSPMAYMQAEEEKQENTLSAIDVDRIIEMAWEDRTPFEAIKIQFGLSESDVRKLMKSQLKWSSYKLWRERVENCKTKHLKTQTDDMTRFKSNRQRAISSNKISKRK
jgi:uncharacterized protein (TIGR03643 family)